MGSSNLLILISIFSGFWFQFVFTAFSPVDNLLFDCGGSNAFKVEDGRTFRPDLGNSDLGLFPKSDIVVFDNGLGMSNLYKTARIFKEMSNYSVNVKQIGRHCLRLHFFPVENSQYNLNTSVFSVWANGIPLLHEFSFAELGKEQASLMKEYVIPVGDSDSKKLILTLSPLKNSVAFINGIEVISVPQGQFPTSAIPIPLGSQVEIPTQKAFQTAYRINMGGPLVSPWNDTLWRSWEPDQKFLINAASASSVIVDPSSIKYPPGVSEEIAPNSIYASAQEMGNANVVDQKFNISWTFVVDLGFNYLVRLHFCDIVSKSLNSLVFNVYINNQSAINYFDISSKTNELAAAYYVDFVTTVSSNSDRILVQVGPPEMRSLLTNAILNGVEIMKISNDVGSLDGFYHNDQNGSKGSNKKRKLGIIIGCSLAGSALLIGIAALLWLYFWHPKKPKHKQVAWLPLPTHVGNSDSKVSIGSYASMSPSLGLGRILAFLEIREATKNFDESLVLGVGGFGKVYRGVLDNGVVVAIKRGNPRSQQGLVEFRTEIEMLSKLRHRHLVSLIGYCEELNEMILVYEYMAGGPLRKHLYGSDNQPLTWKQRLEICIGAAKGLHYLHTGASESIIHRDVKTTNILLDENLTAKVADFGLSKFGPTLDQTHVSTAVKGSFGYLDPEYFRRQQLTEKSDVYSFGVVLMEVLCARPAINPSLPREQVNIAEWAMHWQKRGHLEHIIDPHLKKSVTLDSLRKFGETAEKCLADYGIERPTMGDVLWNLEYALQLQETSIESVADENSTNYIPDIPDCIPRIENVNLSVEDIVSEQASDEVTTGVFSQLMDPKGR
ncbi:hypothetical protein AQUCO_02700262v1 [Aquilegia coerulea]|uniref:Protein kinase domain-containing protein n=1 Tax=Aquilegia coerulea TaxID=218851 RepID=A0A2G5D627_AQUCA|nr:hypothetical protein AQUCO_02700262v1 [Aquilegia coerulea]